VNTRCDRRLAPGLVALCRGTMPSRADASWLESKSAHYAVFHQSGYEQDVACTRKWLVETERLMQVDQRHRHRSEWR
jgi:hypothetical protein